MFEKYTETARRVIFFGRYEASQAGSANIEPEHLLLGLFREDKALANRFLQTHSVVESIRKQIEDRSTARAQVALTLDMPLSQASKRVLAYAAEEGERLSNKHIGTEHLLLGLLREEKCFAAEILLERGLRLSAVREEVARSQSYKSTSERPKEGSLLSRYGRDLTREAIEGKLHPLVNRDKELKRIVRTLCRRTKNNPVIIGEPDAARSSIVECLAQHIAAGTVPPLLQEKRILVFDLSLLETESSGPAQFKERLRSLTKELSETQNVLIFIEELCAILTSLSSDGWLDAADILKPALLLGTFQCIAATTTSGLSKVIGKHREIAGCFNEVRMAPFDESECVRLLMDTKERFEKFHNVLFDHDAVIRAIERAKQDASERSLLIKAMDLLDDAGAHVQIGRADLPEDIRDVQRQINFIMYRMETAIANHEFEKARFYSDEERKERDNLRQLKAKYHIGETTSPLPVTGTDVDEVADAAVG